MPNGGGHPVLRRRGGTRGTLFLQVARLRLDDATALILAARYNGAMYIIGYSIECALKWAIAIRRGAIHLPAELEHHHWDVLLSSSGLRNALDANPVLSAIYSTLADRWHPNIRYTAQSYSRRQAERIRDQYKEVFNWIIETAI